VSRGVCRVKTWRGGGKSALGTLIKVLADSAAVMLASNDHVAESITEIGCEVAVPASCIGVRQGLVNHCVLATAWLNGIVTEKAGIRADFRDEEFHRESCRRACSKIDA
jgi:hypothetical protein